MHRNRRAHFLTSPFAPSSNVRKPLFSWPYSTPDFTRESSFYSGLSVRYVFVKDTYHGYAAKKNRKKFLKPDVVAALNCGFIFYQSWDSSIPAMLQ